MSNPIRERVLGDKGFTNNPEDKNRVDTHDDSIAKMKLQIEKLNKALRDNDKHWESVRSTDYIKAVDSEQSSEKELNTMRKEHDRAMKKMKDMEKEMATLHAEKASLMNALDKVKAPAATKATKTKAE